MIALPQNKSPSNKPLQKECFPFEKGPFALKYVPRPLLISYLENKFILGAQSSRPDINQGEKIYSINIKGKDQRHLIKQGEKIFLTMSDHPSGGIESIAFSSQPTNLWFVAKPYKENQLLLKVVKESQDQGEFILTSQQNLKEVSQEKMGLINLFKEAKIWGKDKFFQHYGADTYRDLGEKFKLELAMEKKREFLFIGPTDYLTYIDGNWKTVSNMNQINKQAPLAHIHFNNPGMFEIDVWDEKGFLLYHGYVKEESSPPQMFSPEQVLLHPKLRTTKQITCLIGKKRVLLKEGDWLMKTKTGWRTLKTASDIENYLNQTLLGELFVFDGLELKNGQYFLKGHWFNELHTSMQAITFPINAEKKNKPKKRIFPS